MKDIREESEISKVYFLCRIVINEQASSSNRPTLRPTPIITSVGIKFLLFAKIIIIIQIWIFAGDSKRVCSIVMRVSSQREAENISVEIMKVGFRSHLKSLFCLQFL